MHHEFRWNWNPTVDSLVLSHLLARISTDTNSKEIMHLSLANNVEPPLYRTLHSKVFSMHFNYNRPTGRHSSTTLCWSRLFLVMKEGYALYRQYSNASKQRHPRHSCYIYTIVEHGRKTASKSHSKSTHLLQNWQKKKLMVFKEINQHSHY